MNDLDLAYLAGFFDGEGSITIHENCKPSPRAYSPNHTLQVSIGNTNSLVLKFLHDHYGGQFLFRKKSPNKLHYRSVAQWTVRAAQAIIFLDDIYPFLKMKRKQAFIAIQFQDSKRRTSRRVDKKTIQWREDQRQLIKQLNQKEEVMTPSSEE